LLGQIEVSDRAEQPPEPSGRCQRVNPPRRERIGDELEALVVGKPLDSKSPTSRLYLQEE